MSWKGCWRGSPGSFEVVGAQAGLPLPSTVSKAVMPTSPKAVRPSHQALYERFSSRRLASDVVPVCRGLQPAGAASTGIALTAGCIAELHEASNVAMLATRRQQRVC